MENMNELKKYEIAGRALQEMISDHDDKKQPTKDTQLGKSLFKILGEALLKEMGPGMDRDPYEGCPKKIREVQKLIRFIDRMIGDYMEMFYAPAHDVNDFGIDDDLKQMKAASNKVLIGAAISKLQSLWNEKEEAERTELSADPMSQSIEIEVVPQDEVRSPTGDVYIIKEVVGDAALLTKKKTSEQFNIKVDALKKWKRA